MLLCYASTMVRSSTRRHRDFSMALMISLLEKTAFNQQLEFMIFTLELGMIQITILNVRRLKQLSGNNKYLAINIMKKKLPSTNAQNKNQVQMVEIMLYFTPQIQIQNGICHQALIYIVSTKILTYSLQIRMSQPIALPCKFRQSILTVKHPV